MGFNIEYFILNDNILSIVRHNEIYFKITGRNLKNAFYPLKGVASFKKMEAVNSCQPFRSDRIFLKTV